MSRIAYPFVEKSTVASNLRAAVQKSNLSAKEIAERAEVKASHLSRFLRTGSGISPDKIERVAAVVGTDVRKIYSPAA